jgi:hypothetical protein
VRSAWVVLLWVFFLGLAACGDDKLPPFKCDVPLATGYIGSDQPLPCDLVTRNAALARTIMLQVGPDFGERWVQSITVRPEERWNCGPELCTRGETHLDGRIILSRSMFSLVHELGHVWMFRAYGTLDATHSHWTDTGQLERDAEYFREFVPLNGEVNAR